MSGRRGQQVRQGIRLKGVKTVTKPSGSATSTVALPAVLSPCPTFQRTIAASWPHTRLRGQLAPRRAEGIKRDPKALSVPPILHLTPTGALRRPPGASGRG